VKEAVRRADGKHFAIKIIKKNKLNPEELAVVHDEVEIMQKVRFATVARCASAPGGCCRFSNRFRFFSRSSIPTA